MTTTQENIFDDDHKGAESLDDNHEPPEGLDDDNDSPKGLTAGCRKALDTAAGAEKP